ncbi:MAG: VCBS repeat-containing protein, partial [Desulfuromonadales bacterium]|nr:VCBS repeat-containing protein [Desulfuromonadales bacterium]
MRIDKLWGWLLFLSLLCLPQSALAAWPFQASEANGTPAVADINGDGVLEVVFASSGGLYCTNAAGELLWLLDGDAAPDTYSSPTLADVDGDPTTLEVIVGGSTYGVGGNLNIVSCDGQLLAQYDVPTTVRSSPLVVDADLDGVKEIYFTRITSASIEDGTGDYIYDAEPSFYALDVITGPSGISLVLRWA